MPAAFPGYCTHGRRQSGDRTFKLPSRTTPGYGRYVKFLSGGRWRGDFKLRAPHGVGPSRAPPGYLT